MAEPDLRSLDEFCNELRGASYAADREERKGRANEVGELIAAWEEACNARADARDEVDRLVEELHQKNDLGDIAEKVFGAAVAAAAGRAGAAAEIVDLIADAFPHLAARRGAAELLAGVRPADYYRRDTAA